MALFGGAFNSDSRTSTKAASQPQQTQGNNAPNIALNDLNLKKADGANVAVNVDVTQTDLDAIDKAFGFAGEAGSFYASQVERNTDQAFTLVGEGVSASFDEAREAREQSFAFAAEAAQQAAEKAAAAEAAREAAERRAASQVRAAQASAAAASRASAASSERSAANALEFAGEASAAYLDDNAAARENAYSFAGQAATLYQEESAAIRERAFAFADDRAAASDDLARSAVQSVQVTAGDAMDFVYDVSQDAYVFAGDGVQAGFDATYAALDAQDQIAAQALTAQGSAFETATAAILESAESETARLSQQVALGLFTVAGIFLWRATK